MGASTRVGARTAGALLSQVRLDGAIFLRAACTEAWAYTSPTPVPVLGQRGRRSEHHVERISYVTIDALGDVTSDHGALGLAWSP